MQQNILCKPDFAMLKLSLSTGEAVQAESGAMVAMSGSISVKTSAKGGILKGFKRTLLGGESFFINTFTAENSEGDLYLSPSTPGDLKYRRLENETLYIQSGAYIASMGNVDVDSKWGGAKQFFAGERFFMLKCSGTGDLWLSSYGAIEEVDIDGSYTVDTGAIVGFEEGLDYRVRSVGGLRSFLFSGEGLVCEFSGRGKLYIQTRLSPPFIGWIHPFRPKKQKSND